MTLPHVLWWHSHVQPPSQRLPPSPRRLIKPSDGRYCYYTVESALAASRELDALR